MRPQLPFPQLAGSGLSAKDVDVVAAALGETDGRKYVYTFSDITQRFIPSLVLTAYPSNKITRELAIRVLEEIKPTSPFAETT